MKKTINLQAACGIFISILVVLVSCGRTPDTGQLDFVRGETAYADHDYQTAAPFFLSAAKKGHAQAQVRIADCYWYERGVSRNDAQALKWYFEAARQANPEGVYRIGVCYEEGRGVGKDFEVAARWYFKASCLHYAEAYYKLGECYQKGRGVSRDEKSAGNLYRKAVEVWRVKAEQGDAEAQYRLGFCYCYGLGVKGNKSKAVELYRRAAENGCVNAQLDLARRYEDGNGVDKDYAEAVKWYRMAAAEVPADKTLLSKTSFLGMVADLEKAAESGNTKAMLQLGDCFAEGNEVFRNPEKAFRWYLAAARNLSTEAMLKLAVCYEKGDGVPADISEAVGWYRQAADRGSVDAQLELARRYENGGAGVGKDAAEAAKWYRKAAEKGSPEAQYAFGACCYDGIGVSADRKEAARWYRKAAEQGYAKAQYAYGECCHFGQGVTGDLSEAVKWYRKAAEQDPANAELLSRIDSLNEIIGLRRSANQGKADAMLQLGRILEEGKAIPSDAKEAATWYRKAADRGSVDAQLELARRYENGTGVDRDYAEALKWYRKAADQGRGEELRSKMDSLLEIVDLYQSAKQGSTEAMFQIGYSFEKGTGVPKDPEEAVKWYRQAVELGYAPAQINLGFCYYHGVGVGMDRTEAANLFREAANLGAAAAQFNLGICYSNGDGVPKDLAEAAKLFRLAAEQGFANAQNELGDCFYYGRGVSKDLSEAVKWYGKAAEQGNENAEARKRQAEEEMRHFPYTGVLELPGNVNIEFVKVEAGTFTMGKESESRRIHPHTVSLKHDFYIGKTEVTQAQWKAVMDSNPSFWKKDDSPVETVSWFDAQDFCMRLNEMFSGQLPSGYCFDLPTEAQWEYAARGGNKSRGYTYSGSNDVDEVAWYDGREYYGVNVQSVAKKKPNELGLYDMSGNVWEWCRDRFELDYAMDPEFLTGNSGSDRVARDGRDIVSRISQSPGFKKYSCGFRVALVPRSI